MVRVVAPSGPFDADLFERGVAILRDRFGLQPRMRADIRAARGYLAGEDGRRVEEWQEASTDHEARAIWAARGGYGAMRLLHRIELPRLLHPPKWVIGYSDITALHAALNGAGLVTCHGPVVTQLPRVTPEVLDHLEAMLFGEPREATGPGPAPGAGVAGTGVIRAGSASGALFGGSLTLLAHLCGTPYLPRLRGAVLFIEDVGEKPYRLDRYLTQLRLSGALDGVRAVCVGHVTDCDDAGVSGLATVRELVRALGVPAVDGVPVGHEDRNLPLPLGSIVTLVAPGPGEAGPPRLLFDQGARA